MEITEDIYQWLKSSGIVGDLIESEDGQYYLSEKALKGLEYGWNFSMILKRTILLCKKLNKNFNTKNSTSVLKQQQDNSCKKFNWAIIKSILEDMHIEIDKDDIELIKAGSQEVLEVLLECIFKYEQELFSHINASPSPIPSTVTVTTSKPVLKAQRKKNGDLVIESISADILLENTDSCLEFLLVSFCKHFGLRPKQSAGLLTQNGKYLGFILAKGLRGKHEIIVQWYEDIIENSKFLSELLQKESGQGSINLVFSALKSGLLSKSLETVTICAKLLIKLVNDLCKSQDYHSKRLNFFCSQWFASEGGIENCLEACKRFGSFVKQSIVAVIVSFCVTNMYELITNILQEQLPVIIEYITTIHEFLPILCENKTVKDEFVTKGIFEFLLNLCIQEADDMKLSPDERIASINMICDIWIIAPNIVENSENISNKILMILERVSRDRSKVFQTICYGKFFLLLQKFTETKNSFAPMVYKIITFSLIENFSNLEIREMLFYNFINLFEEIPEIPLKILLEPLIKHLKISQSIVFTVADFTFLSVLCKNPRLTFKLAVQLIDILAKLFINYLEYGELIGDIFLMISERFIDIESVQQYLQYFIQIYLKEIENSAKNLKFQKDDEKNKAIMEIISGCLKLHSENVNQAVKFLICKMVIEIKQQDINAWLLNILNIIGDPLEIIEEYKLTLGNNISIEKEHHKNGSYAANNEKRIEKIGKIPRRESIEIKDDVIRTQSPQKKNLRQQIEKNKISNEKTPEEGEEIVRVHKLIREITEEENEYIKIFLKSNQGILTEVFKKYSVNYRKLSRVNTFASMSESFNHITDAEYFQIIKDLNLSASLIPQSLFNDLIKEYQFYRNKSKKQFNFVEFQEILIQISLIVSSKTNEDYLLNPPIIPLMNIVKEINAKIPGLQQNKVKSKDLEILNKELKKNSKFELPSGYKKVLNKSVEILNVFPVNLGFSEKEIISVTILDEILNSLFKFHILEPVVTIVSYYTVKPESVVTNPKQKLISPEKTSIKYNTSKFIQNNNEDTQEINEIPSSDGTINVISSPFKVKYINKLQALRNNSKEIQEKKHKEKEKKRLLRVQLVKQKVSTLYKTKQERDLEKKKKIEEDEAKKKLLIQKLEEKIERDRKNRLEEIEKWKKNKEAENKLKEIQEREKIFKEREERIRRRDEFFESEKHRLRKLSQDNFEKKMSISKIQVETEIKLKSTRLKKLQTHKFELEKSRKIREEEKTKEDQILEDFKSSEVQTVFETYNQSLELIFLTYCKIKVMPKNQEELEKILLKFEDFYKFALHFKITPNILSQQDSKKMFISVIKTQGNSAITFESFKLLCFKISKIILASTPEVSSLNSLQEFLKHLELPQDPNSTRNLLRRQETLRNSI